MNNVSKKVLSSTTYHITLSLFIFIYLVQQSSICLAKSPTDLNRVRLYYSNVSKAEELIVESKYFLALSYYKKAFKKAIFNSQDVYNALICAILIGENSYALSYCKILVKRGMSLDAFDKIYAIDNFKKTSQWAYFKKNYTYLHNNGIKSLNIDVRKKLTEIVVRDQMFRGNEDSYTTYKDTIKKIDIQNDSILRRIIDEYGFPDEKLIGISKEGPSATPFFDIIIWHQTQRNFISDYSKILLMSAHDGKIRPQRAAELLENHIGQPLYSTQILFKCDCEDKCSESTKSLLRKRIYVTNITSENEKVLNLKRQQLFLDPLSVYKKKLMFDIRDRRFLFYYLGGYPTYSFAEEKDVLKFVEKLKYISE